MRKLAKEKHRKLLLAMANMFSEKPKVGLDGTKFFFCFNSQPGSLPLKGRPIMGP